MKVSEIIKTQTLENAAKVLVNGGILVFPTDTVYGIGTLLNESAIEKLYKIKNRPMTQPTAILVTREWLEENFEGNVKDFPTEFWSGRLTLILPAKQFKTDFPKMILADGAIGIRISAFSWLQKLMSCVGPIVATSANKKDEPTPKNFAEVDRQIINEADLTVKTNEELAGQASSVYDFVNKKQIR